MVAKDNVEAVALRGVVTYGIITAGCVRLIQEFQEGRRKDRKEKRRAGEGGLP